MVEAVQIYGIERNGKISAEEGMNKRKAKVKEE
jgi:hypothetical protein